MNEFISQNPELIVFLFGGMFSLFAVLGSAFIFMLKRSFDNLVAAIDKLDGKIDGEKIEIGTLKDRMQAIETTCGTMEKLCPNRTSCAFPRSHLVENVKPLNG